MQRDELAAAWKAERDAGLKVRDLEMQLQFIGMQVGGHVCICII